MRTLTCGLIILTLTVAVWAAEVGGTWRGSVDLERTGEHGDPVFVLNQTGGKLTGTYTGPFGDQKVTGTVDGNKVSLEVIGLAAPGVPVTLTYAGTIDGPAKMSGTMTRDVGGEITPGKWTAVKK